MSCFLFGGHFENFELQICEPSFRILGYLLDLGPLYKSSCGCLSLATPIYFKKLFFMGTCMHTDRPKTWCVKCTPMCSSARIAPSNIVYQWYGYRSTGIGVLTTEICFSNIIWIYILCERVLESEFKLN